MRTRPHHTPKPGLAGVAAVALLALTVAVAPTGSASPQVVWVPATAGTPVVADCAPDNDDEVTGVQGDAMFFPNDGCAVDYDAGAFGVDGMQDAFPIRVLYKVTGHEGTICGSFAFSGAYAGTSDHVCTKHDAVLGAVVSVEEGDLALPLRVTWHPTVSAIDNAYLCAMMVVTANGSTHDAPDCFPGATLAVHCPYNLRAERTDDGILLSWDPVPGADGYNVIRNTKDGALFGGHLDANRTTYLDRSGVTEVTYEVTATFEDRQSEVCDSATVAEVPFFSGPVAWIAGLAAVAGMLAVVAVRRK